MSKTNLSFVMQGCLQVMVNKMMEVVEKHQMPLMITAFLLQEHKKWLKQRSLLLFY